MNHKYQLKMLVQNMTQVKPRSPAITQRLLEHDLTRLNGLTIIWFSNGTGLDLFQLMREQLFGLSTGLVIVP